MSLRDLTGNFNIRGKRKRGNSQADKDTYLFPAVGGRGREDSDLSLPALNGAGVGTFIQLSKLVWVAKASSGQNPSAFLDKYA